METKKKRDSLRAAVYEPFTSLHLTRPLRRGMVTFQDFINSQNQNSELGNSGCRKLTHLS